jgi:hypothetical protein
MGGCCTGAEGLVLGGREALTRGLVSVGSSGALTGTVVLLPGDVDGDGDANSCFLELSIEGETKADEAWVVVETGIFGFGRAGTAKRASSREGSTICV